MKDADMSRHESTVETLKVLIMSRSTICCFDLKKC